MLSRTSYRLIANLAYQLLRALALIYRPAAEFLSQRQQWKTDLANRPSGLEPIWCHCASTGEYEQARPVLALLKKHHPHIPIVLSFFSKSGYDQKKDDPLPDRILYLPFDTRTQARQWLRRLNPSLILWQRYDFWFNFLWEAFAQKIPVYLLAAHFHRRHYLMRWWSRSLLKSLRKFSAIFTLDKDTEILLRSRKFQEVYFMGDPRVDRVIQIAKEPYTNPEIQRWKGNDKLMIIGSSHLSDIEILMNSLKDPHVEGWKFLIAPHHLNEESYHVIEKYLERTIPRYSKGALRSENKVVIFDVMGQLARLYSLADACYIGGGFDRSIHNTLEPAAHGIPVSFGPQHHRFPEAVTMLQMGAAMLIHDSDEFAAFLTTISDDEIRFSMARKSMEFIENQAGASLRIYEYIRGHHLV